MDDVNITNQSLLIANVEGQVSAFYSLICQCVQFITLLERVELTKCED